MAPPPPPFAVTPPPPPHFQALMDVPPSQGPAQGVGGYYNPPPRQQQQQQQQLGGFFQPPPFDQTYGVGVVSPHQGGMHAVPIPQSQAPAHGGVGGMGVPHISPPVPAPLSTLTFPLDTTRYYLLGQLEYYLSPQNMAQDFYLRKQVGCCFILFLVPSFRILRYCVPFFFFFLPLSFLTLHCCLSFFPSFLPYTPLLTFFSLENLTDGHSRMDTYTPHRLIQPRAATHCRRTARKRGVDVVEHCASIWGYGADGWVGELCVAGGACELDGG